MPIRNKHFFLISTRFVLSVVLYSENRSGSISLIVQYTTRTHNISELTNFLQRQNKRSKRILKLSCKRTVCLLNKKYTKYIKE